LAFVAGELRERCDLQLGSILFFLRDVTDRLRKPIERLSVAAAAPARVTGTGFALSPASTKRG
jgi:hypothetical protein